MWLIRHRRRAAAVLAAVGTALLAWTGVVLLWGEPFTAIRTTLAQRELREELTRRSAPWLAQSAQRSLRLQAGQYRNGVRQGGAIGRILIPRLDLAMVVVEGTDAASLARGPGHYRITSLPGLGGTVAIAGHRTTYLQPFRHIDELQRGDSVSLVMPYGTLRYVVYGREIVDDHDWSILRRRPFEKLVLTACHPLYSASHRIAVYARLAAGSGVRSNRARARDGRL